MADKLCLITGGAGFIGSHAAEAMLARGWRVRVLDDLSTGSAANLASAAGAELVRGDVRDLMKVRAAARGASCVLHLAAKTSVPGSVSNPIEYHDVDATGTLTALEAARIEGVRRFVMSSTCAVYGDGGPQPAGESAPAAPVSPYAAAKLAAETYCLSFGRSRMLEPVVLRYFNVYGPRQRPDLPYAAAVPAFIKAFMEGRRPVIFGSGLQTRDFVYAGDVALANACAAEAPAPPPGPYNIASGRECTVLNLLEAVAAAFGVPAEFDRAPQRPGDLERSSADARLAERSLGFRASTGLAEGISKTVEWFRRRPGLTGRP